MAFDFPFFKKKSLLTVEPVVEATEMLTETMATATVSTAALAEAWKHGVDHTKLADRKSFEREYLTTPVPMTDAERAEERRVQQERRRKEREEAEAREKPQRDLRLRSVKEAWPYLVKSAVPELARRAFESGRYTGKYAGTDDDLLIAVLHAANFKRDRYPVHQHYCGQMERLAKNWDEPCHQQLIAHVQAQIEGIERAKLEGGDAVVRSLAEQAAQAVREAAHRAERDKAEIEALIYLVQQEAAPNAGEW